MADQEETGMVEFVKCHKQLTRGAKRAIPRAVRFIYLELCLQARELDGVVELQPGLGTTDAILDLIGGNRDEIELAVKHLFEPPDPMCEVRGNLLVICGWDKWAKADTSTERVRRYRAREKAGILDETHETFQEQKGNAPEREGEREKINTTLPAPVYASKLAEDVGATLTSSGLSDVVETANKCARTLSALSPEDMWPDLSAEVALWAAHAEAKKLERAGMGDHWTSERVLHEVFSKCQSRARYRPSDARKEREARRVAKTSQSARDGGKAWQQSAIQDGGGAIDWKQVREDALAADREQALRAARADRREPVDPKQMAEAVRQQLERLKKKS